MNLDLSLSPLLCFCVSLCITLCSVCLHTSVSVFSWVSVCVLSAPTRMFPYVLCPVCPHCSVSVCPWVSLCVLSPHICFCLSLGITLCSVCPHCSVSVYPWVSLCILYPHVCFRLSFVLSVPTALFQSVPGHLLVFCLSLHVFFSSLTGCSGCPRNLSLSVSGKCALLRVGVHLVQAQNHFLFSPVCSKARVLSAMVRRQFPCMPSLRTLTPLKLSPHSDSNL